MSAVVERLKKCLSSSGNAAPVLGYHDLSKALVFGFVYFIAFRAVAHLGLGDDHIVVFWPADGLFLATLTLASFRRWPLLIITGIAVEFFNALVFSSNPAGIAVAFSFANPMEAMLGAALLRRFLKNHPADFLSKQFLLYFFLIATLTGGLGATAGVFAYCRVFPELDYLHIWQTWWLSETLGLIFVSPLLLGWFRNDFTLRLPKNRSLIETILFLLGFTTTIYLAFWCPPSLHPLVFKLPFICIPFLLWAAFRYQPKTVALILFVMAYIAVSATHLNRGFFSAPDVSTPLRVLALQAFLLNVFVSIIFTSTALKDAERAREAKRRADQILQRSERLRLAGETASGVAHDFNNYLSIIRGYTELLVLRTRCETTQKEAGHVLDALNRCSELAGRLQHLGKGVEQQMQVFDLSKHIRKFQPLLKNAMGSGSMLSIELPESTPMLIKGHPGEIDELLLNLAINARDAMPKGGSCRISAERVELSVEAGESYLNGHQGHYFRVDVRDDGSGMTSQVLEHLFEPFFSTKGNQGTGLGMAIAHNIAIKHGGCIRVKSELERGTTISVLFPTV